MKHWLLAITALLGLTGPAAADLQSGSLNGMNYYVQPASAGCSASAPCNILLYLGYMGDKAQASDLQNWFNDSGFAHTIIVAPVNLAAQSEDDSWGGYTKTLTKQGTQAINIFRAVEAQYGSSVNTADAGVIGESLGGTGTQAFLALYGPHGTLIPGLLAFGASFDAKFPSASNADVQALCGVPLLATHGTADTDQPYSYDQNLASSLSNMGCTGFQLNPIQDAPHGTWGQAFAAGTGPGTVKGWVLNEFQKFSTSGAVANVSNPPTAGSLSAIAPTSDPSPSVTHSTSSDPIALPPSVTHSTPSTSPVAKTTTDNTNYCEAGQVNNGFHASNGQIIGPDGKPFIAHGININDWALSQAVTDFNAVTPLLTLFPGTNFIRLAAQTLDDTPEMYRPFINAMTAKGMVVMIDDHHNFPSNAFTGAELIKVIQWFTGMARAFGNNHDVWYQVHNENEGGDISAEHQAVYQAIRPITNSMILFDPIGGGNPPPSQGLNRAVYATMHNVAFDEHVYPWMFKGETNTTVITAKIREFIADMQTVTSADGSIPVVLGEVGPSSSGDDTDANGTNVVEALLNIGGSRVPGAAFGVVPWAWAPGGRGDDLLQGSGMNPTLARTSYGDAVALYTQGSSVTACSLAQTDPEAAAVLSQVTTSLSTPPTSTDTSNTDSPPATPTNPLPPAVTHGGAPVALSTQPTPSTIGPSTDIAAQAKNLSDANDALKQAETLAEYAATLTADPKTERLIDQAERRLKAAQSAQHR
jgi:hypothetical protein